MKKDKNNINRREFIKIVGIAAATGTASLYGCASRNEKQTTGPDTSGTAKQEK